MGTGLYVDLTRLRGSSINFYPLVGDRESPQMKGAWLDLTRNANSNKGEIVFWDTDGNRDTFEEITYEVNQTPVRRIERPDAKLLEDVRARMSAADRVARRVVQFITRRPRPFQTGPFTDAASYAARVFVSSKGHLSYGAGSGEKGIVVGIRVYVDSWNGAGVPTIGHIFIEHSQDMPSKVKRPPFCNLDDLTRPYQCTGEKVDDRQTFGLIYSRGSPELQDIFAPLLAGQAALFPQPR